MEHGSVKMVINSSAILAGIGKMAKGSITGQMGIYIKEISVKI